MAVSAEGVEAAVAVGEVIANAGCGQERSQGAGSHRWPDPNGAKTRRLGIRGYAAFLQNAGLGRCGTQSVALGWYTVSRWDTGRR
jgi:hypothetical protein